MQPQNPNANDGMFWEGDDVRVKLELQERDNRGNWGNLGNQGSWKIFYLWDDLNSASRFEYHEPFAPMKANIGSSRTLSSQMLRLNRIKK